MSTIEEQLRAEIAEMKAKIVKYEEALSILTISLGTVRMKEQQDSDRRKPYREINYTIPEKSISVNDALLKALASGPMPRKDILPAIEALRPGTTGQTVSSALNGLQKAKKVKLQKNGTWIAL